MKVKNVPMDFIIADDSVFFRNLFRKQLSVLGHTILAEAKDGAELIEKVKSHPSAFVLTDVDMQPMNGMDASIEIRKLFPTIKIICSTQFNLSSWISEMQLIGISGYVYKNSGVDSLAKAINSAIRGEFYIDNVVLQQLISDLKSLLDRDEQSEQNDVHDLQELKKEIHTLVSQSVKIKDINGFTPNSRELLILSATAQGRPVKQIADMLHTTERNISKIKEKMRDKTGVSTNAELLSLSHRLSWI